GILGRDVTGVQTCALPILVRWARAPNWTAHSGLLGIRGRLTETSIEGLPFNLGARSGSDRVTEQLSADEVAVLGGLTYQVSVGSLSHDPARVHHDDLVGLLHRGHAVCH